MRLIAIYFFLLYSVLSWSQTNGFYRQYYFSNSVVSVCRDAFESPSGNLILVGLTYDTSQANNSNKLTIVGTDPNGNYLWRKNYGSKKFEHLDNILATRCIYKTANNFFYFASVLDSNNKYLSVLTKFDFSGDTLWQKKFYDPTDDVVFQGIAPSFDGGWFVTGFFQTTSARSVLIIKTDLNGKELWRKKVNSTNSNPAQDGHRIIQDSLTKKLIIVGYQYIGTKIYSNVLIADSLGNKIFQTNYSGTFGGQFNDLIQTIDKNFIAVGIKDQGNNLGSNSRFKGHVVKFDISGSILWQREFDTLAMYNNCNTVNELPNGDLIIGGHRDTCHNYNLPHSPQIRIIKLDKNGNLKWKKYYGPNNNAQLSFLNRSLNLTSSLGMVIANEFWYKPNPRPLSIIKIDSTGCDTFPSVCQNYSGIDYFLNGKNIWTICPNPSYGLFNLSIPILPLDSYIQIINSFGLEIKRIKIESLHQNIDIREQEAGFYLLNIIHNGRVVKSNKLIKQ